MSSENEAVIDWVNLPSDARTISLWDSLHDGDLIGIESDPAERTILLRFDVEYVRNFHKLPVDTRFAIKINGVQSVRCFATGAWTEESVSWDDFQRLSATEPEVSTANLAEGSNTVALQIGLLTGHGGYAEMYLRGEQLRFYVGDSETTKEEFVQLGEAYWAAFASRAEHR
jgi:hypothetical protein